MTISCHSDSAEAASVGKTLVTAIGIAKPWVRAT
jgi:hypothetical protein